MSFNPLKRYFIKRFNKCILAEIQIIIKKINKKKITILDAGCGEGFITNLIAKTFPHVKVDGIDISKDALKFASQKETKNCRYLNLDIKNLTNEKYDIVICTEVLEHLSDFSSVLKKLENVASKALLISVPNEPWFSLGNLLFLKNVTRFGNPIDHINKWTGSSFKKILAQNTKSNQLKVVKSFPWIISVIEK